MKNIYFSIFFITSLVLVSCNWNLDYIEINEADLCENEDECKCGEYLLFDERDSTTYETVWIDSMGGNDLNLPGQCWMRENLKLGKFVTRSTEMLEDGIHQKFCLYDDSTQCDLYGGYYHWREAMDYENDLADTSQIIRGICPTGWHIPSKNDFEILISALDGNLDQFLYLSGFSGQLSGYRVTEVNYGLEGTKGYLWSSRPNYGLEPSRPWVLELSTVNVSTQVFLHPANGACVRCVRD